MASEFTKGPWERCFHLQSAENDASCPCGFRGGIWGADGEHVVCEMGSTETKGEEGMAPPRYPRAVELANARLIAAAPELLEALKEAEKFVDRHSESWYTTGQELLAKIRAAIAKAEGR